MTERKGLKKIVRERMERTGETYSTAHRIVGARRPKSLPPGIVAGYSSFGSERHRPSALVRHMLAQAEVPLSEAMVCGLGGGVGFLYAVFEYAALPHPLLTIVAQHHPQPWAAAVLGNLGLPCVEQRSSSTPAAMTKLRTSLDAGRPVMCTVNRAALPWHAPGMIDVAADPYPVVVAGIDGDILYVDDTADRPHEIPSDLFASAWSGSRKARHHMVAIDALERPTPDMGRAIASAVSVTAAHLSGPVLGNSFDVNMGLRGMTKFAAELRDRRTRTGWVRRFGDGVAFDFAMRRIVECLQREYTAPDATRPIYSDFLAEAARLLPNVDAAGAAGLFRESGAHWASVTVRAQNADVSEVPELFDALADHVEAAHDAESRAVSLLA
jgi:Butirosin biosynthesis protein H, N-terminal/Domain of unknown function (DUF4872)